MQETTSNKTTIVNCKNCGLSVNRNFCSHCGQKSSVSRIDLSTVLQEISESVFQMNRGFFFTMRELSLRPGKALNEFVNGMRKNHFKPIAYLLILSTVYFLITEITDQNTFFYEIVDGWMKGITLKDSIEYSRVSEWIMSNYAYTTLFLLPVFSLASYISFRKSNKNYLEHLVINSYITGQQALLYSVFALARNFIEWDGLEIIPLFLAVFYVFWVYWALFSKGSRKANIRKTFFTYFLYFTFVTVLLIIFTSLNEVA